MLVSVSRGLKKRVKKGLGFRVYTRDCNAGDDQHKPMSVRLLKRHLDILASSKEESHPLAAAAGTSGGKVTKRAKGKRRAHRGGKGNGRQKADAAPDAVVERNLEYFRRTTDSKAIAETAKLMTEVHSRFNPSLLRSPAPVGQKVLL